MIFDLEFIHYLPRAGGVVARAYEQAIAQGITPAPLLGYWSVDVGHLNSAVLLWTYDDLASRESGLQEAGSAGWPLTLDGTILARESMLLEPAAFNGPLEPGEYGTIYEIRIYDYEAGSVATVAERWADMVGARRAISPLLGCFSATGGDVDKWVHIWPYEDGRSREIARGKAAQGGIWPPETGEWLLHQENMIVLPSAFSPLH